MIAYVLKYGVIIIGLFSNLPASEIYAYSENKPQSFC